MANTTATTRPTRKSPGGSNAPPFLPATRPRRLTISNGPKDARLGNYGVFAKLPLELRRQILIDALGGRRLHIHLAFDCPLERKRPLQGAGPGAEAKPSSRWKGLALAAGRKLMKRKAKQPQQQQQEQQQPTKPENHCGLRSQLVRNKERPRCWQWFGCVCHRQEELSPAERRRLNMGLFPEPQPDKKLLPEWDMCCSSGVLCECQSTDWKAAPSECFVGAMSWLVSCRQAYADAIDVLYGENAFHLDGPELIQNLPRLLLPQRLASIRSIELLWKMPSAVPTEPQNFDDKELQRLCHSIPEMFPRLEKLHLSLICDVRPPGSRLITGDLPNKPIMAAERALLAPVEAMLLRLQQGSRRRGVEHEVAIAKSFWKMLLRQHDALRTPGLRVETDWAVQGGRFWKRLPEQRSDGGELGYWVCGGFDDTYNVELAYDLARMWGLWRDGDDRDKQVSLIGPLSCPLVITESIEEYMA